VAVRKAIQNCRLYALVTSLSLFLALALALTLALAIAIALALALALVQGLKLWLVAY